MKPLFTTLALFFSFLCTTISLAQNNISPVTITLPTSMPANTADWATAVPPVMIMASVKPDSSRGIPGFVRDATVLVTVKNGGNKVCGSYTSAAAPAAGINSLVKLYRGADVVKLLGQNCVLKPGTYSLCVQFFYNGKTISEEICKQFTIIGTEKESYSPPQNIIPANNKIFTAQEAKGVFNFRWTPVVPKPKENVTYRLKVWQLMQGQNGTQAMRSNTPIIVKDVDNITQASISNLYTGPCKPPYLCDFAWNVETSKKSAIGTIELLGNSQPTFFSIQSGTNVNVTKDSVFCKNQQGNYPFKFSILNNDSYNRTFTNLSVYSINGVVQGLSPNYLPIPSTQLTPGTGAVINANSSLTVNGYLNYSGNINDIIFLGSTLGGVPPKAGDFDFTDTLKCNCTACDSIQIKLNQPVLTQQGNNVNILQPISTLALPANTPLKIKSLTAEIIYLDIKKDVPECYQCEKNSDHLGKFLNTSSSSNSFSVVGSLPGDEIVYNTPTPQALINVGFGFTISVPDLNKCCKDTVNACIRYSIVTEDCKTCSITMCYALPRVK